MAENLNQKARGVAVSNRQIPVSNQPSGEPQVPHYRVAEGLLGVQGYFQVRGLVQAHSKPRSWSFQ
jgi:hypothetical protein